MKRSILGSRVYAPSPTGDGAPVTGVVQAVKQENRDVSSTPCSASGAARRSVYTVLLQDGTLREFSEEEIAAAGFNHGGPAATKGALKSNLKVRVRARVCVLYVRKRVRLGRPAGCAPLFLFCSVLQRLTASCAQRIERPPLLPSPAARSDHSTTPHH